MTTEPPRSGTPIEAWEYRGRPCRIYPVGPTSEPDFESLPDTTRDYFEDNWCGYTTTKITPTPSYEELDVRVYGGLTYAEDGWIGFDTMHGFHQRGPENLEEMKAEVEHLVDELIEAEDSW